VHRSDRGLPFCAKGPQVTGIGASGVTPVFIARAALLNINPGVGEHYASGVIQATRCGVYKGRTSVVAPSMLDLIQIRA
jgi:hypothetical protein